MAKVTRTSMTVTGTRAPPASPTPGGGRAESAAPKSAAQRQWWQAFGFRFAFYRCPWLTPSELLERAHHDGQPLVPWRSGQLGTAAGLSLTSYQPNPYPTLLVASRSLILLSARALRSLLLVAQSS
jgi:hypothetical protein